MAVNFIMTAASRPHVILSRLEAHRQETMLGKLATLIVRRGQLVAELESMISERNRIAQHLRARGTSGAQASDLATFDTARRELSLREKVIRDRLSELSEHEATLRRQLAVSMNKSALYTKAMEQDLRQKNKQATVTEQRNIDDIMAHRHARGNNR